MHVEVHIAKTTRFAICMLTRRHEKCTNCPMHVGVHFTCVDVHHSMDMVRYITHAKAPFAAQFRENIASFATQIEGNASPATQIEGNASFATQIVSECGVQRHNTEPAIYPGNKPRHPLCGNGWRNNLDPNPPSPKPPLIKILSSTTPIFLGKNLEPFLLILNLNVFMSAY